MSRLGELGHKLYAGEVSYDIVGHRKKWYIISAVIVGVSILSLFVRGINTGIEFTGGAEFQVPSTTCTVTQARQAVETSGVTTSSATQIGNDRVRITTEPVSNDQSLQTKAALAEACGVATDQVDVQIVGPTWGGEITKKAIQALVVFILLCSIFLAIYFTWQMAVAAMVALVHDIVITIGVYSLLQFEVTPSTVVGILTILGYSLYDTVVVFDKVKENTRGILGQSRYTYGQSANLAVNQTLVRSINTSIVALLPVGAILFVGAGLLGAGTLKDLSLALFVGIAAGAYSSIFIATPFLVQLMERDPQMQSLAKRVAARGGGQRGKGAPRAQGTQEPEAAAVAGKGQAKPQAGKKAAAARAPQPVAAAPAATQEAVSFDVVTAGGAEVPEAAELEGSDAMTRARARRAAGPSPTTGRQQPKRTTKSKRK